MHIPVKVRNEKRPFDPFRTSKIFANHISICIEPVFWITDIRTFVSDIETDEHGTGREKSRRVAQPAMKSAKLVIRSVKCVRPKAE